MKARELRAEEGSSLENSPVRPPLSQQVAIAAAIAAGVPVPNFLAPTKAFLVQSAPNKTVKQVLLSDEELAKQEEARVEAIANTRRKFKEQHKKTLQGLVSKH